MARDGAACAAGRGLNFNCSIEGEHGRQHFVDLIAGGNVRSTKCWAEGKNVDRSCGAARVSVRPADTPASAQAASLQEEYAASGDADGFVAVDREFHTTFVTAAGNPIITGLYDSLRDRQQRMIIMSLLRDTKRVESILVEHRQITGAIRAGDLARADAVLVAHLRGTLDLVRPR